MIAFDLKEIMEKTRSMLLLVFSFLFAFILFLPLSAGANQDKPATVDELVSKAVSMNLHNDRYWHIIMHYEKGLFGYKSQIDDASFFFSDKGKYDPEEELKASIKALFADIEDESRPDICQFISRYEWLAKSLDPDPTKIKIQKCDPVDNINPLKAYLVFPTASINSPASMFGHTFVNIKTTNRNDLLSHAVNYAARTEETNGMAFAIGALMGFYKGDYSVLPYYKKILEYTDMDRRDIWEYELNLNEAELRDMVRHIREMEKVNIDYYFFDDNCAYNILYLLDAARPSLDLVGTSWIFTIPSDTVVDAYEKGVITGRNFRPSKATKIRQKMKKLGDRLTTAAIDIKDGTIAPSDAATLSDNNNDRIMALDLATEMLQYDFLDGKKKRNDYSKRLISVLTERSKLGQADPSINDFPAPNSPDTYHRPKRITLAGGADIDGNSFYDIGIRFAYNDVPDPDYPIEAGTQIQFGNAVLRYESENGVFGLERIDVIDLLSLSPRDAFFKPWSWNFTTGFKKEIVRLDENNEKDTRRELFWQNTGGIGLTWLFKEKLLLYGLIQAQIETDNSLEYGWAAGPGFMSGVLLQVADPYRINLEGSGFWYGLGDVHDKQLIKMTHRLKVARNCHLGLDASKEFSFDSDRVEISVKTDLFF